MRTRIGVALGLAVMAIAPLAHGCSSVSLQAEAAHVETPAVVRVSLAEIDGDILKFVVLNLTNEPMMILRDEVVLVTARGTRRREPGGIARVYNVPPTGGHDVNVRFYFGDLQPGERVEVHLANAVRIHGAPVAIRPFVLRVGD